MGGKQSGADSIVPRGNRLCKLSAEVVGILLIAKLKKVGCHRLEKDGQTVFSFLWAKIKTASPKKLSLVSCFDLTYR